MLFILFFCLLNLIARLPLYYINKSLYQLTCRKNDTDTVTDVIIALDTSQGMSLAVDTLVADSSRMAECLFAGTSGLRLKVITHSCGEDSEEIHASRKIEYPHQLKVN